MEVYETQLLTREQTTKFTRQFERQVGTEYEVNEVEGKFYIVCFELLPLEVYTCFDIEQAIIEEASRA